MEYRLKAVTSKKVAVFLLTYDTPMGIIYTYPHGYRKECIV